MASHGGTSRCGQAQAIVGTAQGCESRVITYGHINMPIRKIFIRSDDKKLSYYHSLDKINQEL